MAILYAPAARGSVVLAEFTGTPTNASAIARQILEKIRGHPRLLQAPRTATSSTSSAPTASPCSVWPMTPPASPRHSTGTSWHRRSTSTTADSNRSNTRSDSIRRTFMTIADD
ncbi:Vesicle-associated membrane protein 711 [Apostasia shenzhenica]|uniref:Vesicle-associated membrane protein 711 n=1 Tax=Apostasia shenzhenica TaxID=1088818 RepID=A0A2I0BH07_9ASPA|nr:Vesicle-associated membrane protein 711 [Apostasia shenzhenica]